MLGMPNIPLILNTFTVLLPEGRKKGFAYTSSQESAGVRASENKLIIGRSEGDPFAVFSLASKNLRETLTFSFWPLLLD